MIGILIFTLMITAGRSLEPEQEGPDQEIKKILNKYVNTIPDLPPKYVINEGLTNMISKYYEGKLATFPLYKISLKIDRKPVRIPWTLGAPSDHNEAESGKKYTFVKVNKPDAARKPISEEGNANDAY